MPEQQVRSASVSMYDVNRLVTCNPKTTLCTAAVASPATARLAHECGLQVNCDPYNNPLQEVAGAHADIQTLATLRELGMVLTSCVVEGAAWSSRLNILQHLITEQHCPKPYTLSDYAARSGSVSMLKWLKAEGGFTFASSTCRAAAACGRLEALQHLRSEGCNWAAEQIARDAACSGSIEMIDWLWQQQGIVINAHVLADAAGSGHIALCKHLRESGCNWDASACTEAATYGHFEVLRWLRESGCPWDAHEVCKHAGFNGSIDTLSYVMQQGEDLNAEVLTDVLNAAGTENQLQTAQWLRQRGAQWPALLGYDRAELTQQWWGDTLVWARAEGCTSPIAP
jgi:hypothetical protein